MGDLGIPLNELLKGSDTNNINASGNFTEPKIIWTVFSPLISEVAILHCFSSCNGIGLTTAQRFLVFVFTNILTMANHGGRCLIDSAVT